jgi:hypothetical protein
MGQWRALGELGNELSVSIDGVQFLGKLSNYYHLKKTAAK